MKKSIQFFPFSEIVTKGFIGDIAIYFLTRMPCCNMNVKAQILQCEGMSFVECSCEAVYGITHDFQYDIKELCT